MTQEQFEKAKQLSRQICETEYSLKKLTALKSCVPDRIIIRDTINHRDAEIECSKDFCIEVIDAIIEAVSPQVEGLKKYFAEL